MERVVNSTGALRNQTETFHVWHNCLKLDSNIWSISNKRSINVLYHCQKTGFIHWVRLAVLGVCIFYTSIRSPSMASSCQHRVVRCAMAEFKTHWIWIKVSLMSTQVAKLMTFAGNFVAKIIFYSSWQNSRSLESLIYDAHWLLFFYLTGEETWKPSKKKSKLLQCFLFLKTKAPKKFTFH